MSLLRLVLALLLLTATLGRAEDVPVAQAREIGIAALAEGRLDLASIVAQGLLDHDPTDAFAHLLVAKISAARGDREGSRKALRRAFHDADKPSHKFQAAQLAARQAYEDNRLTTAQIWLRRSLAFAPDDRSRQVVARDYRILRAKNPLNVSLDFSVAPSSNVNNGADSAISVIAGLPFVGQLNPAAMALSGTATTAEGRLRYRLQSSEEARTDATVKLGTRQVRLTPSARAAAPTVSDSDFSSVTAELGLAHLRKAGAGVVGVQASAARSWQNGSARQDVLTLGLSYGRKMSDTLSIQTGLEREWRIVPPNRRQNLQAWTARTGVSLDLGAGELDLAVAYRTAESADQNRRSSRWLAYAGYDPDRPLGPATLSLRLGAVRESYQDYMVGFFAVPGGRQDETVFANVDLLFKDVSYGGFAPSVTVSAQQTRSNVSHFSNRQLAVSFGIRSAF